MKTDLVIKNGIVIPYQELEIITSRSGGPGGQHVNKSDTRITIKWNVIKTQALNEMQKNLVMHKLQSSLTTEGDLIIHSSASRSQQQNKEEALEKLKKIVRQALHIPKKRLKTKVPEAIQESRLRKKAQRATIKKLRSKKIHYDDQ